VKLSTADLDIFFDERHQRLAAELTRVAPEIAAAGEAGAAARAMGRLGLYEWLLPRTPSVDVRALCLVREMLGYVSPLADAIFAVQGLGAHPLVAAGVGGEVADQLRRGEAIAAFALTEPEAGSDAGSLRTRARQDAGA
jgi:acyl-CoA dehydrogenase